MLKFLMNYKGINKMICLITFVLFIMTSYYVSENVYNPTETSYIILLVFISLVSLFIYLIFYILILMSYDIPYKDKNAYDIFQITIFMIIDTIIFLLYLFASKTEYIITFKDFLHCCIQVILGFVCVLFIIAFLVYMFKILHNFLKSFFKDFKKDINDLLKKIGIEIKLKK